MMAGAGKGGDAPARKAEGKSKGAQPHAAKSPAKTARSDIFSPFEKLWKSEWVANPVKLFFTLCILWLMAIFLFAALSPPVSWSFQMSEAPLHKNSALQVLPGESYTYEISEGGQAANVTIGADSAYYCPGILMYDTRFVRTSMAQASSVCLNAEGEQISRSGEIAGSNVSYSNISWPYFQPWMLAVEDGWQWGANASFSAGAFESIATTAYEWKVAGSEDYLGRQGWIVVLSALGDGGNYSEVSRFLIDKEKRIALKYSDSAISMRLVGGPFGLSGSP